VAFGGPEYLLSPAAPGAPSSSPRPSIATFHLEARRRSPEPDDLLFSFAEWGYDAFGYFLVTQAVRIASAPEEVRAFAEATNRSVKYAVDHPEEAARILVRHNPTLDYELVLAQWRESIAAIDTPFVRSAGYGEASEERLKRTIELVKRAFPIEKELLPQDVRTDSPR
jgi:NitT/TauT family transport system substrate-binding protein